MLKCKGEERSRVTPDFSLSNWGAIQCGEKRESRWREGDGGLYLSMFVTLCSALS